MWFCQYFRLLNPLNIHAQILSVRMQVRGERLEELEYLPNTTLGIWTASRRAVVHITANFSVCLVIYLRHSDAIQRQHFHFPPAHRYIFSLALADLLVILICVPLASLVYTLESWPWGGFLCAITEFAKDISIGVSVFTLAALSAERYCAIVNPLRKLQVRNGGWMRCDASSFQYYDEAFWGW